MTGRQLSRLAKALRHRPTEAEEILWLKLRARRMQGMRFRRQQPIEGFIVDFVCFEKRIVIELDGGQHAKALREDRLRDRILNENGFRVLRFWNNDVLTNLDGVLEVISRECSK